jgi:hypothetical protein
VWLSWFSLVHSKVGYVGGEVLTRIWKCKHWSPLPQSHEDRIYLGLMFVSGRSKKEAYKSVKNEYRFRYFVFKFSSSWFNRPRVASLTSPAIFMLGCLSCQQSGSACSQSTSKWHVNMHVAWAPNTEVWWRFQKTWRKKSETKSAYRILLFNLNHVAL